MASNDTKRAGKAAAGEGFSAAEKAAMKERAKELKTAARADKDRAVGEAEVLAKIAEMAEPDRSLARRIHELVLAAAPELWPKTWYSMPAYARAGKVVCFFQSGAKFGTRYSSLGFSDQAALDDGDLWPTAYAIKALGPAEIARITALVRKASGLPPSAGG
ncbi:MAG: DUF1801 domain-containing protein [Thermoflexales bacterium]|nr:DUF1801 domain-containing protein [Thermoflexales bacterium]